MGTEQTLDEVLEHYGILGMRWGVRRTPEQLGRDRARRKKKGKPVTPISEDAKRKQATQAKIKKEGINTVSNNELKELNKRLNMEQQYRNMTKEQKRKLSDQDKKLIGDIINAAGKITVAATGGSAAAGAVGTALEFAGGRRRSSGPTPTVEVLETRRG